MFKGKNHYFYGHFRLFFVCLPEGTTPPETAWWCGPLLDTPPPTPANGRPYPPKSPDPSDRPSEAGPGNGFCRWTRHGHWGPKRSLGLWLYKVYAVDSFSTLRGYKPCSTSSLVCFFGFYCKLRVFISSMGCWKIPWKILHVFLMVKNNILTTTYKQSF